MASMHHDYKKIVALYIYIYQLDMKSDSSGSSIVSVVASECWQPNYPSSIAMPFQ